MNINMVLLDNDRGLAIVCGLHRVLLLMHGRIPGDWYMTISSFEQKDVDGVDELTFLQGFEDI